MKRKRKESDVARAKRELADLKRYYAEMTNRRLSGAVPPPMPNRSRTAPPVFSECVIGFRVWKIDALARLRPWSVDQRPWLPGVNVAACDGGAGHFARLTAMYSSRGLALEEPTQPRHKAPDAGCACGLYARFDLDGTVQPKVRHAYPDIDKTPTPPIYGAVAAWGDLQVHADGFRTEKACVVALAWNTGMPSEVRDLAERVATRYRVALVNIDDIEREAELHGQTLPMDVRPPKISPRDYGGYFGSGVYQQHLARQMWASSSANARVRPRWY